MTQDRLVPLLVTLIALAAITITPSLALADPPPDHRATAPPQVTMEEMLRQDDGGAVAEEVDATGDHTSPPAPPPSDPNWAAIIGQNALWGGITGGLIGFGAWLVTGRDFSPWVIAQFFGGGLLVGAAIGVISLSVHTDRYAHHTPAFSPPQGSTPVTHEGTSLGIRGRF